MNSDYSPGSVNPLQPSLQIGAPNSIILQVSDPSNKKVETIARPSNQLQPQSQNLSQLEPPVTPLSQSATPNNRFQPQPPQPSSIINSNNSDEDSDDYSSDAESFTIGDEKRLSVLVMDDASISKSVPTSPANAAELSPHQYQYQNQNQHQSLKSSPISISAASPTPSGAAPAAGQTDYQQQYFNSSNNGLGHHQQQQYHGAVPSLTVPLSSTSDNYYNNTHNRSVSATSNASVGSEFTTVSTLSNVSDLTVAQNGSPHSQSGSRVSSTNTTAPPLLPPRSPQAPPSEIHSSHPQLSIDTSRPEPRGSYPIQMKSNNPFLKSIQSSPPSSSSDQIHVTKLRDRVSTMSFEEKKQLENIQKKLEGFTPTTKSPSERDISRFAPNTTVSPQESPFPLNNRVEDNNNDNGDDNNKTQIPTEYYVHESGPSKNRPPQTIRRVVEDDMNEMLPNTAPLVLSPKVSSFPANFPSTSSGAEEEESSQAPSQGAVSQSNDSNKKISRTSTVSSCDWSTNPPETPGTPLNYNYMKDNGFPIDRMNRTTTGPLQPRFQPITDLRKNDVNSSSANTPSDTSSQPSAVSETSNISLSAIAPPISFSNIESQTESQTQVSKNLNVDGLGNKPDVSASSSTQHTAIAINQAVIKNVEAELEAIMKSKSDTSNKVIDSGFISTPSSTDSQHQPQQQPQPQRLQQQQQQHEQAETSVFIPPAGTRLSLLPSNYFNHQTVPEQQIHPPHTVTMPPFNVSFSSQPASMSSSVASSVNPSLSNLSLQQSGTGSSIQPSPVMSPSGETIYHGLHIVAPSQQQQVQQIPNAVPVRNRTPSGVLIFQAQEPTKPLDPSECSDELLLKYKQELEAQESLRNSGKRGLFQFGNRQKSKSPSPNPSPSLNPTSLEEKNSTSDNTPLPPLLRVDGTPPDQNIAQSTPENSSNPSGLLATTDNNNGNTNRHSFLGIFNKKHRQTKSETVNSKNNEPSGSEAFQYKPTRASMMAWEKESVETLLQTLPDRDPQNRNITDEHHHHHHNQANKDLQPPSSGPLLTIPGAMSSSTSLDSNLTTDSSNASNTKRRNRLSAFITGSSGKDSNSGSRSAGLGSSDSNRFRSGSTSSAISGNSGVSSNDGDEIHSSNNPSASTAPQISSSSAALQYLDIKNSSIDPNARAAHIVETFSRETDDRLQEAIELHEAGKLTEASELFRDLADPEKTNHPLAQVLYGLSLRNGWGVPIDEKLSFHYLLLAGQNSAMLQKVMEASNFSKASNNNNNYSTSGSRSSRSPSSAANQSSSSSTKPIVNLTTEQIKQIQNGTAFNKRKEGLSIASGEMTIAMYELGNCFRYGWGCEKDPASALKYYKAAAHLGDADAMYETAWCYDNSFGTPKKASKKDNRFEAAQYYRMAEAKGKREVGNSWIWKDKYNAPIIN